ncbi:hypothetical protein CDV36_002165 [Fusarium kuroshium]|uniref:Uncharacterized protein n=2 Tax=Fusarium solani species complex TaxID=232080 RepID=A0A3M2SKW8_9HYPO|nr:hypothetical protein CDV36_002165 [Fusarium kuroshium]
MSRDGDPSYQQNPETWYQAHILLEPDCIASMDSNDLCIAMEAIDTLDHAAIGDVIHDCSPTHRVNDPPSLPPCQGISRVNPRVIPLSKCLRALQVSSSGLYASLCLPGDPVDQP